jgi:hypothetical protein
MDDDRSPGWDMRAITTIANGRFGGLKPMFTHHGWDWSGARWLGTAKRSIVKEYGSIAEFRAHWSEARDGRSDGHPPQRIGEIVHGRRAVTALRLGR